MLKSTSLNLEVFTRGVEDIITREELSRLLSSKKQLRIKHGIDATGELHIGHAVSLWKLRALQEMGHKAVILLGDITTQIGDPTGRSKSRPVLSKKEISQNLSRIIESLKKVLLTNSRVFEIHRSSEWYGKMKVPDFIKLLSLVTHARLIEREMFRKRMAQGAEIFVHELIYPVLQGYDSVMLKSDATIIGSDQIFNEHIGRMLQERFGQKPQVIITCKILPGLEGGEKMSKSAGNFIGIEDAPDEKLGKAMRILDELIIPYLEIYTDTPTGEVKKIEAALARKENPRDIKLFFAEALVRRYHGEKIAKEAKNKFLRMFSKKETADIPLVKVGKKNYLVLELLETLKFISSRAEGRRLISQRAVKIDNTIITRADEAVLLGGEMVVRVGKRKFTRVIFRK